MADSFSFMFEYNSDLLRIQTDLAQRFSPSIKLQDASFLHMTLVYMDGPIPWEFYYDVDLPSVPPFMFNTEQLGLLDMEDGKKAVVLLVDKNDSLVELQSRLYQWAVAAGMKVDDIYAPANWIPHITLGFTEDDLQLPAVEPMQFAVSQYYLLEGIEEIWLTPFDLRNTRKVSLLKAPTVSTIARTASDVVIGDKEYTMWPMLGFPYGGHLKGGPTGLDFHRTYFDSETDLGWEDHIFPVYMDHAMSPEIGRSIIGFGRIADEVDTGRLVELYVEKANRYHDLLVELDEMGYLRGSGQAIASCYDVNPQTRHIDTFHVAEYSFTVEPSNNLAAPVARHAQIEELLRKYKIKDSNMSEFQSLVSQYKEEDQMVLRSFNADEQKAFVSEEDEEKRAALIEAKRSSEEDVDDTPNEEPEEVRSSAKDKIDELFRSNTLTEEQIANEKARMQSEQITALSEQVDALQRQVADLLEAQYALAENLARNLPALIAEGQSMSQPERDRIMRNAPKQPLQLPMNGKNRPVSAGLGSPGAR